LELEAQRMYRRGKLTEIRKSRLYSCSRVQQKVRVDLIVCPLLTKSAAVRAPDDVPGGNLQNANVRHCVLLLANASGKRTVNLALTVALKGRTSAVRDPG